MKPVAVVDGSNVALEEKTHEGKASMHNLMKMKEVLEARGYRPIIIVDAKLRYEIDERREYDHMDHEGSIYQAPAGTEADYFVLHTADRENAVVISNDRYQDYQAQFPWIDGRRIPFMIVDGDVILYCPDEGEGHHAKRSHAAGDHADTGGSEAEPVERGLLPGEVHHLERNGPGNPPP